VIAALVEDRILYDASGRPSGMRRAISDLTARKRAEEALRQSE
jgi:PAS domain-containing protein